MNMEASNKQGGRRRCVGGRKHGCLSLIHTAADKPSSQLNKLSGHQGLAAIALNHLGLHADTHPLEAVAPHEPVGGVPEGACGAQVRHHFVHFGRSNCARHGG